MKALTDICCTSSNAVEVVASIPEDREVLFCPDQFLGAQRARITGRRTRISGPVNAHVHAGINGDELAAQAASPPTPSCMCTLNAVAPHRRSTWPVRAPSRGPGQDPVHRRHAGRCPRPSHAKQVLVATEVGMLHQLRRAAPGIDFQAVNDRASCRYMKMITPAALLRCLVEEPTRSMSTATPPSGRGPVCSG